MIVEGIESPPIPARHAPADFLAGLPDVPPTLDQTYQLLKLWDNVINIARLAWEDWDDTKRCVYMIFDDGRQFRVT